MVLSNARLVSRWLPMLGIVRGVSTSPVLRESGPLARDGRVLVQLLRKDAYLVGILAAMMVSIGSYTVYSTLNSRANLGKEIGFTARREKFNYNEVVLKARKLLAGADVHSPEAEVELGEEIYGRVCSTVGEDPPIKLSSDPHRKSVFLFGPDAVRSILLQQSAYSILCSIGRDKDYLQYTMVEQQSAFWLILFTRDASPGSEHLSIAPATWDGVIQHTRDTFPDAYDDLMSNIHILKRRRFEEFEEEAGFQFLDAKKNRHGEGGSGSPPYFSYKYFCTLPKPRTAWQVRAFLFCELRLLKLFTGDGYTCNEGVSGRRVLEYLGPNVQLGELDSAKLVVLRMNVQYPDVLARCHR